MKKHFNNWLLIPFIFILALPLLLFSIKFENGSKNYFAFLKSILIPIFLKNILRVKPFVFVLLSLPALFFSIIYTVQILEYDTYVNISTWATVFDSHTGEMKEFISGLKTETLALIFIQILTYIAYLFLTYKRHAKPTKYKYIILAFLVFFIVDYFGNGATAEAFPLKSIQTLGDYLNAKRIENKYLDVKKNATFNAKQIPEFNHNNKETIVIFIGESLRRDRLEYYGYNKPTTPLMNKEDLIIYKDVVSAANQTINSLKRVFTLAEYLDDSKYWIKPSFIKSFTEVGYKTYWLTNQPVYGEHESEASYIARETDVFISSKNTAYFKGGKNVVYDGVLLDKYKNIVNNDIKKKVIFIHLLGNHYTYKYRYPEKFNFFNKKPSKDDKVNLLREYDNAVRYNDDLLSKALNQLKKIKGEKSFIMFSDHGESLFDNPTTFQHGSSHPSKSEVEIPLILWFSKEFKQNHTEIVGNVRSNVNQPILSSDFFHAIPSLFGIQFDDIKKENNFFSKDYTPKTQRKIINVNHELLGYNSLSNNKASIDY